MILLDELLPRREIVANVAAMRAFIGGRRVLVTGAGGSIGSELCRHLARLDCATLVMFERHENSLYEVLMTVDGSIAEPFLGDILDAPRLNEAFVRYRPEVVFHAAAHKHVPLLETHVSEAVKNNVSGTRHVAEAADLHGVERFVLISSDKAVNPSSVMGATKRVAELLMREVAPRSRTEFVTVRFGNVLGSNGSVVPRFVGQIRAGGPITVTHPDVRRFFIRIREAVQLVIEAAALGNSGAMYVLDMGDPVRIVDLARRVMEACGARPSMPIEFIGLRPGEKLDEELIGANETAVATMVPHIAEIRSSGVLPATLGDGIALLEALTGSARNDELIEQLRRVVPEFVPAPAALAPQS